MHYSLKLFASLETGIFHQNRDGLFILTGSDRLVAQARVCSAQSVQGPGESGTIHAIVTLRDFESTMVIVDGCCVVAGCFLNRPQRHQDRSLLLAAFRLLIETIENLLIECLGLSRFIAQGENVCQFGLALLNFCCVLILAGIAQSEIEVLLGFDKILIGKSFLASTVDILPVRFSGKGRQGKICARQTYADEDALFEIGRKNNCDLCVCCQPLFSTESRVLVNSNALHTASMNGFKDDANHIEEHVAACLSDSHEIHESDLCSK